MYVIIVGGGKTGSHLAEQLLNEGHRVRLIEIREAVAERLKQELSEEIVLAGDGSSPRVLEQAGIDEAQVLAALTGEDETNLVITTLARFEFDVTRIIARVNNPKNAWLFGIETGVDVALNQADLLTKLIVEEMSLGDIMTLLKLRRGEYSLVEERVHIDLKSQRLRRERRREITTLYSRRTGMHSARIPRKRDSVVRVEKSLPAPGGVRQPGYLRLGTTDDSWRCLHGLGFQHFRHASATASTGIRPTQRESPYSAQK